MQAMKTIQTGTPRLEEQLNRELDGGEQIIWLGQPIPRYFTMQATLTFLMAIPFLAFAIGWTFGLPGFQKPDFTPQHIIFFLFGLLALLVGVFNLTAPLRTYWKAKRSIYAITNYRAIILEDGWGITVRSYPPAKLQNICRKDCRTGTGDIIFDQQVKREIGFSRTVDIGFLNIPDVRRVEQLLRQLAGQAG